MRLEDEVERARQEREACLLARERLEREQASALRQLQIQAAQNEITRRSLERARQEVIRQATVIRAERDALEREVGFGLFYFFFYFNRLVCITSLYQMSFTAARIHILFGGIKRISISLLQNSYGF